MDFSSASYNVVFVSFPRQNWRVVLQLNVYEMRLTITSINSLSLLSLVLLSSMNNASVSSLTFQNIPSKYGLPRRDFLKARQSVQVLPDSRVFQNRSRYRRALPYDQAAPVEPLPAQEPYERILAQCPTQYEGPWASRSVPFPTVATIQHDMRQCGNVHRGSTVFPASSKKSTER